MSGTRTSKRLGSITLKFSRSHLKISELKLAKKNGFGQILRFSTCYAWDILTAFISYYDVIGY